MAYNKAKAERAWLRWKTDEENRLRNLGVGEDLIQRLHAYDWQEFCSERRFLEKQNIDSTYIEICPVITEVSEIQSTQDFLDSIESPALYAILKDTDTLTLQIAVLKTSGLTTDDICKKLDITDRALYCRWDRLKQKIKKFFKSEKKQPFPTAIG
ncbi:MAG: sigma-70 family RNA polymerase sigma factor [Oscillospiraceae bacterium]